MASSSLEEEGGRRFAPFCHSGKRLMRMAPISFGVDIDSYPFCIFQRSLVQIKSHGQKVLQRADAGEDLWAPLREKPALVAQLVAKQMKSPNFLLPRIPTRASIAPRKLPKPKLKPRPVTTSEEIAQGVLFSIGNGRRENETSPAVFRTQFGGTGNRSFTFPPQVEDEHPRAPYFSSSETFEPSDCRTPERPEPQIVKSTAVLAATALCQLSLSRDNKKRSSDDQEQVNIVSP